MLVSSTETICHGAVRRPLATPSCDAPVDEPITSARAAFVLNAAHEFAAGRPAAQRACG